MIYEYLNVFCATAESMKPQILMKPKLSVYLLLITPHMFVAITNI